MAIGIDFGTTNSSIVHYGERGSTQIEVGVGREPYPAVLRTAVFTSGDKVILGRPALDAAKAEGGSLMASFKPLLNEERLRQAVLTKEVVVDKRAYSFVEEGPVATTRTVAQVRYGRYSRDDVVEASARVLRQLLEELRRQAGLTDEALASEAVFIGVPVGYGPTARRRLLDALVRAGLCGDESGVAYRDALNRVNFVYEPIALIPMAEILETETVLVFDYGGGTLDLGVWRAEPIDGDVRFRQLALGGHPRAGDVLDRCLLRYLEERHLDYALAVESGRDEDGEPGYDTLRRIADLKEELSTTDVAPIQEGSAAAFEVTRADFDRAIAGELEVVEEVLENCLVRAGVQHHEVDRVVMSGGSSLVPAVKDLLWRRFPTVPPEMFLWPDPNDVEASRSALTGVSRGLAEFGWGEQLAATSSISPSLPGDLLVWSEPADTMVEIAHQGSEVGADPIRRQLHFGAGATSVAVYERIAEERLVVCLEDVPVPASGLITLEIYPDRFGLVPRVRALGGRRVVAEVDLGALSDDKLKQLLRRDGGWSVTGRAPRCGYLSRPLRVDDYVRVPGRIEYGRVVKIEDIRSGRAVPAMEGWKLGSYRLQIAGETNGSVSQMITKHRQVHLH
jgi:hypothetical protein